MYPMTSLEPTMTDTTEKLSPKMFERTTCWKCDGTGHIRGFEHVHGGDCFACNAQGGTLTERGERQRAAYDAAMQIVVNTVDDVKVGQRVNLGGFLGRVTVTSVEWSELNGGQIVITGENKKGERLGLHTFPGTTVRRTLPRAELNALIARCLEIQ